MKRFFITLLLCISFKGFTQQLDSLDLIQKVKLDTKVELSKNYLQVSAGVTAGAWVSMVIQPSVLGFGTGISGLFTTPYYGIRYWYFVDKRNRFYKENNIQK